MNTEQLIKDNIEQIEKINNKNADLIKKAQEITGKEPKYDNLFILRFILSNPLPVDAERNLVETLNWRMENDKKIKDARNAIFPFDDTIGPLVAVGLHKRTRQGEPVLIVRSGLTNTPLVLAKATIEEIAEWLLFQREEAFMICDEESRRQGVLVKTISINDFAGLKLAHNDRRFFSALGSASKSSEIYFPQLLSTGVMINTPSWMGIILRVAKVFMSKKMMDKIRPCPGKPSHAGSLAGKDDMMACPWAKTKFDPENLPTFLGGKCECKDKGGCISGLPNDFLGIVGPETSIKHNIVPGMTKINYTISPKSSETISIKGPGTLSWQIFIQGDHGLNLNLGGKEVKVKGRDSGQIEIGQIVVIKLENTSMTKSKKVEFSHELIEPVEELVKEMEKTSIE